MPLYWLSHGTGRIIQCECLGPSTFSAQDRYSLFFCAMVMSIQRGSRIVTDKIISQGRCTSCAHDPSRLILQAFKAITHRSLTILNVLVLVDYTLYVSLYSVNLALHPSDNGFSIWAQLADPFYFFRTSFVSFCSTLHAYR